MSCVVNSVATDKLKMYLAHLPQLERLFVYLFYIKEGNLRSEI